MDKNTVFDHFIKMAVQEYEDGETGLRECLEKLAQDCFEYWFKKQAMSYGIPESVVNGKTRLRDHFSQEYIDWQCNKGVVSKSRGEL